MKRKSIISALFASVILAMTFAIQYVNAANDTDSLNRVRVFLKNGETMEFSEEELDSITTAIDADGGGIVQNFWHNGSCKSVVADEMDSICYYKPTLELSASELEFGRVERGAKMRKSISITNTGKYPAVYRIGDIFSGEISTEVAEQDIVINAGETKDIEFTFFADPQLTYYREEYNVKIYSDNLPGGMVRVSVGGDLIEPIPEETTQQQSESVADIVNNSVDDNFNAAEQIAEHKEEIEQMESVNEVNVGDAATEVTYTNGEHIIYPYSYPSAYEYDGVEEMDSQIDAGKANKAKKAIQKSGLKAVIFNLFDGEKGRTNQNNMVKAAANILDQYYDVTFMEFTANNVIKAFKDQYVEVVYFSTYGNEEGNKIATKDEPREDGTFVIDGKKYGCMSVNALKKVTPQWLTPLQRRLVYMASCNSMKAISQFSTEVDFKIPTTYVGWDGVNVDGQAYGVVLFDMLLNYEKTLGEFFTDMKSNTLGIKDHKNNSYLTAFPSGESPTKLGFNLYSKTKTLDHTMYITSPETGMYKELGWIHDGKLDITVSMKRTIPVDFNLYDRTVWCLRDNRDVYKSMMFDCLATGFNHSCEDKYDKRFVRTHLEDAVYPPKVSYRVKPGVTRLEVRSYRTTEDYFSSEGYAPIDRRSSEPVYLIINNGFLHNAAELTREVPEPLMVTTGIVTKKLYAVGQVENVALDSLKTGFEYWEKGSTSKNTVQATNVGSHFIAQLKDVKPNTVYNIRAFSYDYDNNIVYSKETMEFNSGEIEGSAESDEHEYIDLGLPSGTLWATCNVGANSPEEYGDYFAWGETKPKSNYSWSTYFDTTDGGKTFGKYNHNGKKTLDPEDDAAFTSWGEDWKMPTGNEFEELRTECTWTWNSSKKGYDVVGPNKKAIFIPATGHILNGSGNSVGQTGNYWVNSLDDGKSNLSVDFHFSSSAVDWNYDDRYHGHSIRPVYNKKQEPQTGTHEYVDLGLSVKWATCNVGANSSEEYGDYFAWGETKPKDYYGWSTYKWCNGSKITQTKYCTDSYYGTVDNKTTLELADDAAHVNWGGSWRMPTKAEQDELQEKCTWTWTTQNGKNGYKVTSKINGNSIFLPAAGYRDGSTFGNVGSSGYYWSSSLDESSYLAYILGFYMSDVYAGHVYAGFSDRYYGRSVRAVCP